MKFTEIIVIAVIFISFSHANRNIFPLSQIYDHAMEGLASAPELASIPEHPDFSTQSLRSVECMKSKLNLDNKNLVTTFKKGINAVIIADIICIKDKYLFWINVLLKSMIEANSVEFERKIDCFKYELNKLEPTSILLKGFNADVNNELSNCDIIKSIDAGILNMNLEIQGTNCKTGSLHESKLGLMKEIILANGYPTKEDFDIISEELIAKNIKEGDDLFKCIMDEIRFEN